MKVNELREVLDTLKEKGLLVEENISYETFLDIFECVNKNLKEDFKQRIKDEMVKK